MKVSTRGVFSVLVGFTLLVPAGLGKFARAADTPGATNEQPHNVYSPAEMVALFVRPTNAAQLLQNLKIAVDRDLLLQRAFSDTAVLEKVFAGSAVTRQPFAGLSDGQDFSVTIDDPRFPKMTVFLRQGAGLGGADPAHRFALLKLNVAAVPGFDVCAAHDVFGPGDLNLPDPGLTSHGVAYPLENKGKIEYRFYGDPTATPGPPYSRRYVQKDVSFGVKFNSADQAPLWPSQRDRIYDRDVVQDVRIVVEER